MANNTNNQKKYASLQTLQTFLSNLKAIFAAITHTHSYDDLRNKPFYEGTDYSSILINGTSTVNFYEWGGGVYGAAVTDAPKAFPQDTSHKVIWDGVEYTMTSAYGGDNEAGNPIVSLGAPYGDYSTYPFGIDSYQTASGTYEFSIHTNSTDATHTIDILELGSSFVTLDDRFISNNIARTLDVDTSIENLRESVYSKADQTLTMIYDSGEINEAVNTIVADVDLSGYKTFQIVVQNVNDGSNTVSTSGSAILTSQNGTTYQFPMFNSLFGNTSGRISGGFAHFKVIDGWVMCKHAANINSLTRKIFSETDDGTVTKFSVHGGSGIARCTSALSTLAVTSYNYNTSAYFGVGSRIMVWGCKA